MTKLESFLNDLETVVSRTGTSSSSTKVIKRVAGGSVRNNRVPSVNQVITYLTSKNSSRQQREIGNTLRALYDLTRSELRRNRLSLVSGRTTSRTDAVDINEFISNLPDVVSDSGLTRKVNALIA